MSGWKKLILDQLISVLLATLSADTLRGLMDKVLDWIETMVEESDNDIDDKVVLPLVSMIRTTFNIPDNDE